MTTNKNLVLLVKILCIFALFVVFWQHFYASSLDLSDFQDHVSENGLVKIYWKLNGLQQDDPRLIEIIRDYILVKPSNKDELNLSKPGARHEFTGQYGQPLAAEKLLNLTSNRNGFFIEAGAAGGETYSNSLYFELKYNWTGLLVEPNPDLLKELYVKHRNAYILPHCLSTKKEVETVSFDVSNYVSGILQKDKPKPSRLETGGEVQGHLFYERQIEVQCFPLYSVLKALNNPNIDYFSLDIEGAEFVVLKTIPWHKVNITLIDVEVNHAGVIFPGTRDDIQQYLAQQNFKYVQNVVIDDFYLKQ